MGSQDRFFSQRKRKSLARNNNYDQAAEIVFPGQLSPLHRKFKILLLHQKEQTGSWLPDMFEHTDHDRCYHPKLFQIILITMKQNASVSSMTVRAHCLCDASCYIPESDNSDEVSLHLRQSLMSSWRLKTMKLKLRSGVNECRMWSKGKDRRQ